ncbi:MAG: hypothetical protein OEW68_16680 [Gammaproteobacteria bacterium]|nr:hypothetical protein [Gammaproteobacteria bacterium]MDH4316454.1 hypothetical protein [Gammaproteobacteria bacterium]MDH5215671.1 hypothetical protein [Gammaproteobacteria bacterium]
MKFLKIYGLAISIAGTIGTILVIGFVNPIAEANAGKGDNHGGPIRYELWGSDQSNSVPGQASLGVNGSFVWIWHSDDVEEQVGGGSTARPLPCAGTDAPCDTNLVFPADLDEYDEDNEPTGDTRPLTGRLHSSFIDPQQKYALLSFFSPGGGMVGIMDAETKEGIALFRASRTGTGRTNHMSFWRFDGLAILVCNLDGRIVERIDVTRDANGQIIDLVYNMDASLGVGKDQYTEDSPRVYLGENAIGNPLMGSIQFGSPDFGDLTPNGFCKENGCASGTTGSAGGRPNNAILCPIPANDNSLIYVTLAGGGLLVVDSAATPMAIVGEYGNEVINGAGCAGAQANDRIYLDAGVSASPAGATQSTFGIYVLPHSSFPFAPGYNAENTPTPVVAFKDPTNTSSNGNVGGMAPNLTGQLPSDSTRRDAHGVVATVDERFVHTNDRIRNNVEVVRAVGRPKRKATYDLTSADGKGRGIGPCEAASVEDDASLPLNDPAPDLMSRSPNGDFLFVAFRGPAPVTASHASQGSCPGVGVVRLKQGGKTGKLVGVLRATNTIDTAPAGAPPGGHPYTGQERADMHFVDVRILDERGRDMERDRD